MLFDKKDETYPENFAEPKRDDAGQMQGVYAGPAYYANMNPPVFHPQTDPRMFQTVYGGPDFFSGVQDPRAYIKMDPAVFAAASASGTAQPDTDDGKPHKWCINCGTQLPEDTKFCFECGQEQPKINA